MTDLDSDERAKLTVIYDLMDRYQNLEQEKLLPLVAIRMLCLKHGYGPLLQAIEGLGVDSVVLAAKGQLMGIVKLWEKTITLNPPPEEIREGVLENVDTVRRAQSNVNVNARLYKQLNRMALREQWRRFTAKPKSEGEALQ